MIKKVTIYVIVFVIFIILLYIVSYSIRYNSLKNEIDVYLKNKNDEKETPNILIQTYYDKKKIPQKVYDNINKYASNYKHIIFDDDDCIKFLSENYSPVVVKRFNSLKLGAFKADLFRYCWLYKNGGVYMDIKTILLKDINKIFTDKTKLYTVNCLSKTAIYQGIISTPPNNPIFKELIPKLCLTHNIHLSLDYGKNTKDFYSNLDKSIDYILFKQYCCNTMNNDLAPDRYNFKCSINSDNKERLFLTRYPDFPW